MFTEAHFASAPAAGSMDLMRSYGGSRAGYLGNVPFGSAPGVYEETRTRMAPAVAFPPKSGITAVFDGTPAGEGGISPMITKVYGHANTNLLDAKHSEVIGRITGPPGGPYFHEQWVIGNALFCVEDCESPFPRPFPTMAMVVNQPVTFVTPAQLTFSLIQAADEMQKTIFAEVRPPSVGPIVDILPQESKKINVPETVKDVPERELFESEVHKEFQKEWEARTNHNPLLRWNNIVHIRKYVRFVGFLSNIQPKTNRVEMNMAISGNYHVQPYWGASLRTGDHVGFVIKRDNRNNPEDRTAPYLVHEWHSSNRSYPLPHELEFYDMSGKVEYGVFFHAGIVSERDPITTAMLQAERRATINRQSQALLGTIDTSVMAIHDALSEAARVSNTASRPVTLNVLSIPRIDDVGSVYAKFSESRETASPQWESPMFTSSSASPLFELTPAYVDGELDRLSRIPMCERSCTDDALLKHYINVTVPLSGLMTCAYLEVIKREITRSATDIYTTIPRHMESYRKKIEDTRNERSLLGAADAMCRQFFGLAYAIYTKTYANVQSEISGLIERANTTRSGLYEIVKGTTGTAFQLATEITLWTQRISNGLNAVKNAQTETETEQAQEQEQEQVTAPFDVLPEDEDVASITSITGGGRRVADDDDLSITSITDAPIEQPRRTVATTKRRRVIGGTRQ